VNNFKVFKTSAVSSLTEVRLYDDVFEHVKESHGDDFAGSLSFPLPSIVHAVGNAIMDPTHVEEGHSNSVVFVDVNSTNASGDPLRVPVKIITGASGRVKTFFFASSNATPKIIFRGGE
jgi:hypothetical protein